MPHLLRKQDQAGHETASTTETLGIQSPDQFAAGISLVPEDQLAFNCGTISQTDRNYS